MWNVLPSLIVLGLVAIAAARLARGRFAPPDSVVQRIAAARLLAIATLIQGAHFVEEWLTGFSARFPALFGLEPMPTWLFVSFNVAWIAAWIVSVPFLRRGHGAAFFAAWFLAIAGVVNGVAHPILAVAANGYFPGLITSPFIGIAGITLWRRLIRATAAKRRSAAD